MWDGEKVKVCRGVNSFQTTNGNQGDSFKKIKLVEAMDMIKDDITMTAQDNYIGKYVRDQKFCDLQTAISKCTSVPAHQLKLKDRGLLKEGYCADVLVINYDTIADVATYGQPHQFSTGIDHVFVNGVHTLKNGEYTGCKLSGVII